MCTRNYIREFVYSHLSLPLSLDGKMLRVCPLKLVSIAGSIWFQRLTPSNSAERQIGLVVYIEMAGSWTLLPPTDEIYWLPTVLAGYREMSVGVGVFGGRGVGWLEVEVLRANPVWYTSTCMLSQCRFFYSRLYKWWSTRLMILAYTSIAQILTLQHISMTKRNKGVHCILCYR